MKLLGSHSPVKYQPSTMLSLRDPKGTCWVTNNQAQRNHIKFMYVTLVLELSLT